MPSLKHLHTFVRSKKNPDSLTYGGTYRCIHPDCTSYHTHDMLAGKRAKCQCGAEFIIEPKFHFHRVKLQCIECSNSGLKLKRRKDIAAAVIETVLNPPMMPAAIQTILHEPSPMSSFEEAPELDFGEDDNQEQLEFVPSVEEEERQ